MTKFQPEEYSAYRLQRAIETIPEVETLMKGGFWNAAISRMYYACFYAVGALLIKHGIDVSTHAGARLLFGKHFVKEGKIDARLAKHYTDIFVKRNKGDYNDFFDYDEETTRSLFQLTKEFVLAIEELLNEK
jgi:uncharacterized protein (UPF0332 family)